MCKASTGNATLGGHSGGVDNDQRAKLLALQHVYLMQQLMDEGGGYDEE